MVTWTWQRLVIQDLLPVPASCIDHHIHIFHRYRAKQHFTVARKYDGTTDSRTVFKFDMDVADNNKFFCFFSQANGWVADEDNPQHRIGYICFINITKNSLLPISKK